MKLFTAIKFLPFQLAAKKWGLDSEGKPISLPSISLIITYKNEPRSTLLRTIVSVFERTDSQLLKEIILVDDNNEDLTVGEELQVSRMLITLQTISSI